MTARGVRLNNPGNIERGPDAWQGESTLQDDPRFIRFEEPKWGLRALMKIMLAYQDKHDLHTVEDLISRWAPPVENDTQAYAQDVANHLGVNLSTALDLTNAAMLIRLAQAISVHENGRPPPDQPDYWYGPEAYQEAARLALS
jgi:hypothetical protein